MRQRRCRATCAAVLSAARETSLLVTLEDHFLTGGLFSIVSETLVRHGQTAANRSGALDTGRPGSPLDVKGLAQAQALARRWESEVAALPRVVAVSPLRRTRQTAAPLLARCGVVPLE